MKPLVPLPRKFYEPSAKVVAPKLLGHWLIRETPSGHCGGPIVEVEAYLKGDPAAHSYVGLTKRNLVMWGPPGHSYVYFIYGNHFCVNAVCRPAGAAEAILIRAVEPVVGLELMQSRRVVPNAQLLTNGPGKLCVAMDIDRSLDGADLCDASSPLFIARNPRLASFLNERGPIVTTTRIGITKAAALQLRFYLEGSAFVSRREPRQSLAAPSEKV
jgi:DNA-3-methyladenine glycosylase